MNKHAAFDRALMVGLLLTIWGCLPFVVMILIYAAQGRICRVF